MIVIDGTEITPEFELRLYKFFISSSFVISQEYADVSSEVPKYRAYYEWEEKHKYSSISYDSYLEAVYFLVKERTENFRVSLFYDLTW